MSKTVKTAHTIHNFENKKDIEPLLQIKSTRTFFYYKKYQTRPETSVSAQVSLKHDIWSLTISTTKNSSI